MPDGNILTAWDEKAEKMGIVRGVIDLRKQTLEKRVVREESSYPMIAVGERTVVVVGMHNAVQDILLQAESTEEVMKGGRHK